jgi:hypothetical protein
MVYARILAAVLATLLSASVASACDFGHAIFRRADGAALEATDRTDKDRWFEASGIEGVAGFEASPLNCNRVDAPCIQILPVDAAGGVLEGRGDGVSLSSDGRDASPGADGEEAPFFVWINGFGTFFRVCVATR